jgi:PAS domain S-box-containing protein
MINVEQLLQVNTELTQKIGLYKESLEKMNGVLFIIDYNSVGLSWAGENFEEITGYRIEDLDNIGENGVRDIYHPDDLHFFSEGYNFFMNPETKDKSHTAVYRLKHKRGHYIWLYFSSFVISRNPDGTPHKAGGIMINLDKFMITPYFENQITEQKTEKAKSQLKILSKREIEILSYLSKGLSAGDIADKLDLSSRTIETHKSNIQKKLGLKSTAALISFAVEMGL